MKCKEESGKWKMKGGTLREAATLLSGSVVAQAITLVAYFVLMRIYTSDDYGLFSIFYSYIEVIIILSTCKYELAIVPAASDRDAKGVARFALRLNAIVSLVLLALLTVLTLTGCLPDKFRRLGYLTLLIAPMVFLCGTNRVYGELANRRRRYRTIAASEVTGSASGAVLKTLFGLLGMHSAGMPLGTVLGQAAANVVYRLRSGEWRVGSGEWKAETGKREVEQADAAASLSTIHFQLSTYKNFPLYVAPKDILNSFSANLPFLWLALWFDNAVVGLFALAMTFTARPIQIASASFERVLNARSAEAVHEGRPLMPMLRRFLLPLSATAVVGAAAMWLLAGPLFGFMFGDKWADCEPFVRALLPWAAVAVCSLSLMYIPNLFGTQRVELIINIVQLALRAVAIAIGIAHADFLLAIVLFYAASALVSLASLLWYLWQARRHDRNLRETM